MEKFNFAQQWYPIITLEDLESTRPTAATILGQRIVIWKPRHSEQYRIFLDQCPHRLAPLSEGRIDETSDRLMCSYHGWEFEKDGRCAKVPQADKPDLIAQKSDYLCAIALPCQQAADTLWVWPDPSSSALAAETPLPLSECMGLGTGFSWTSYMRDVDYDWQTLVENLVDPSHVPFAHHGLQGKRERAGAAPIQIETSSKTKMVGQITAGFKSKITFAPPCFIEYEIPFGPTKQVGLVTYCVPTTPGRSRLVAFFLRNFAHRSGRLIPRWLEHLKLRNRVIDSDMVILQNQEYFLSQKQEPWQTAYKMPTQADRFVIEFRRWLDKYSNGALPWPDYGITPAPVTLHGDRRKMMDRYSQHTAHCASCRQALQRFHRVKLILMVVTIAAVMVTAGFSNELRLKFALPLLAIGAIGGTLSAVIHYQIEPKFYFEDYIHPDHK